MRSTRSSRQWHVAAAGLLALAACSTTDLETRRPNRPPDTRLTSAPPESLDGTSYRVDLAWLGSDADDGVDHYEFVLLDHPAAWDSLADVGRGLALPAPDDPRWRRTARTDSTLIASADTLRRDPRPGPGETPGDVLQHFFERWHTFVVRAVDQRGQADPTPDYVSFNARTLAPTVGLLAPVVAGSELEPPARFVLSWDGEDRLDKLRADPPDSTRWVLVRVGRDFWGRYLGMPDSLYRLAPSRWSPWRAWDAADGSGRRVELRDLEPATRSWGFYLFAVQAKDAASAVTPVFDDGTPGKNNVARIFVHGGGGPILYIAEANLGACSIPPDSEQPRRLDAAAGQELVFRWDATSLLSGTGIDAYRYGWDRPAWDAAWDHDWSPAARTARRRFDSGTHRLEIEARDAAGNTVHGELRITITPVTRRRQVLLVDDTDQPQPENEAIEDERWRGVFEQLGVRGVVTTFDPRADVWDVEENRAIPPTLAKILDYDTVIWMTLASHSPLLYEQFFDPFTVANLGRPIQPSPLRVFLASGGRLWICGQASAQVLWPMGDGRPIDEQLPVNVTNWDDFRTPHPERDSVGVSSLLYRMGVEAFDRGGGGPLTRRRLTLEHGCTGLRRTLPRRDDELVFWSETSASHRHALHILAGDLDGPASEHAYWTSESAGHTHGLTLTVADVLAIQHGREIDITTQATSEHTHVFRFEDVAAATGAPPILVPGPSWTYPAGPVNPWQTRANIEIYDMPSYLASHGLAPPAGSILLPYAYASAVPATSLRAYPLTGDGEPGFVLAKASPADAHFSTALCGFEPYVLTYESHLRLVEYVLTQLGSAPAGGAARRALSAAQRRD